MCQYSAKNGNPSKWHYLHLAKLMRAGAGMMLIESTSVSKIGRISDKDLTLINKNNVSNFSKLIKKLRKYLLKNRGSIVILVERSSMVPWIKSNFPLNNKKGWKTLSLVN